jgi:hypothetical protein
MVRWGQIARFVVALLLVPLCVAAALSFGWLALTAEARTIDVLIALLGGAGAYALAFVFFHRSMKSVISKGPLRRTWGTITGYNIREDPRARSSEPAIDDRGRPVPLWAVLLQYLVPLYTVIGVLVVWLVQLLVEMSPAKYQIIMSAVIGFTYAFHVFMVCQDIRDKHRDLRRAGYLFTLVLMFLVNVELLAALGMLVFHTDWIEFNVTVYYKAIDMYTWFWHLDYNPFRRLVD